MAPRSPCSWSSDRVSRLEHREAKNCAGLSEIADNEVDLASAKLIDLVDSMNGRVDRYIASDGSPRPMDFASRIGKRGHMPLPILSSRTRSAISPWDPAMLSIPLPPVRGNNRVAGVVIRVRPRIRYGALRQPITRARRSDCLFLMPLGLDSITRGRHRFIYQALLDAWNLSSAEHASVDPFGAFIHPVRRRAPLSRSNRTHRCSAHLTQPLACAAARIAWQVVEAVRPSRCWTGGKRPPEGPSR